MTPQEYLTKFPNGAPKKEWSQAKITTQDWPRIVKWANQNDVTWAGGNDLFDTPASMPSFSKGKYTLLFLWLNHHGLPVLSYQGDGFNSLAGWKPKGTKYISQNHPDGMGPCNFAHLVGPRPQLPSMDF